MQKRKGFTLAGMTIVVFILVILPACVYGWIENIVKLIHLSLDTLTVELLVRIIGILVFPVGIVMGFIN
jgi:hypothetical protein